MALKELDQIKEGDIVGETVLNNQDNILIAKGAILTIKHIRILKTWGIQAVHIQDLEDHSELVPNSEDLEALKLIIDKKFTLNKESHPFLDNLRLLLLSRHQQQGRKSS